MIRIIKEKTRLVLEYQPEHNDPAWVDNKLQEDGEVTIASTFHFKRSHLITENIDDPVFDSRKFILGTLEGSYYKIDKNILGLKFDLLLDKEMGINAKTFISEGRVSIFRKIDQLVEEQIIIGGKHDSAIPLQEFKNLLNQFPTSTTLSLYAHSNITRILKDYFDTMTDAQKKLDEHLKKRSKIKPEDDTESLRQYEIEKYQYIHDSLVGMLKDAEAYSEEQWQRKIVNFILLLFPKYVIVLEKVKIRDFYANPVKVTNRFIDLTLIDANGNMDIIEIKKPFESCLLSAGKYRDNYTPKKELSGAVMQIEKYIFHLNKWGVEGEKKLNKEHSTKLPKGMQIKITNPKAMILLGRDNDFAPDQKFDFEIMKRKYANIIDIMTYDDLMRRLENIIAMLKK